MTATGASQQLLLALGPTARTNELLRRHTSYKIGGPADVFIIVRTTDELRAAVSAAVASRFPWRLIGSASNLLISDDGVEGLVIKPMTRGLRFLPGLDADTTLIQADAGCMLAAVAHKASFAGLAGLEWAASVPGTVGASVVNNSGAFGSSVAECLESAALYFPREQAERDVTVGELGYTYRGSRLKRQEWSAAVLSATFRTRAADPKAVRSRLAEVEERRKVTQPFGPSVGSVFRNPEGGYAGALIEESGLKGTRVGGVEISPLHANFMLNVGHATARDVLDLITLAQVKVWERHGVWLVPEMELVGRWSDADRARLAEPTR